MQINLKDPVTPSKKATKPTLTYEEQWEVIYSRKNTASDLEKISEVRTAIANGEIAIAVQPNKLSKAYVMKLYETLKELRKDSYIRTVTANMPDNYYLADTNHHLTELSILLDDETEIALDTETTGVGIDDRICGVSLSLPKSNTHFYIPCRHTNAQHQIPPKELFNFLRPYLEDSYLGKVLHNAKFDSLML
jgi:DNA polymerase-1